MRFGWSCSAKSLIETKIVHFASLFLTQDTLFHYLDPCCKIPDISFADIFSIYIFLLIRSSVDDDDDESEYIYSAQYTVPWVPQTFLARFRFPSSLYSDPARPSKISAAREKNLWYPG